MKPPRKSLVPIRRDGVLLAEYPAGELESRLETGALGKTDECYSEEKSRWVPIREFIETVKQTAPASYRSGDEVLVHSDSAGSRRRRFKRRSLAETDAARHLSTLLVNGLIIALTAALVGGILLWGWINIQSATIQKKDDQVRELQQRNDELMLAHPSVRLLFSDLETADQGVIRGRAIVLNASGKRRPATGLPLNLYTRASVESFLNQRYATVMAQAAGKPPGELVSELLQGMPSPVEVTTTNTSGFYSFKIPSPGQYVIYAQDHPKKGGVRIWFVAFDSSDHLNTPVDLTELNKVSVFKPDLMINEGR